MKCGAMCSVKRRSGSGLAGRGFIVVNASGAVMLPHCHPVFAQTAADKPDRINTPIGHYPRSEGNREETDVLATLEVEPILCLAERTCSDDGIRTRSERPFGAAKEVKKQFRHTKSGGMC